MEFIGKSGEELRLLEDEISVFLGRKPSAHAKYMKEGCLLLGKSAEEKNYGKSVFLDAISPHTIFICGSKGTGKSYSLGCIAEELVLRNPNVACVIIDPIGIFWSMKYPNKEEKELEELKNWGLEPKGLEKVQIFIPLGMRKKVPEKTYDKLFSIRPCELTLEDWILTFNLERFSPIGLLLEKALEKVGKKHGKKYGIEELIQVIEKDKEFSSKETGYKQDTRRALTSRLEAAKIWGILSKEGTNLSEVCKQGSISVIDISFLEENVASLVIGMLSRKILNARKMVTRKASIGKYILEDVDELLDIEIPPTWLFIDEAHTLIPSIGKTAASDSLIEYVKQGRRPGCSLVFATQQPSAISTRILSQLDLLICHKLVFDEDLKAVVKRMPTLLPKEYEKTRFLKTMPVGVALIGDRSEETSRAFCIKIRPRFSQHEGREIYSLKIEEPVKPEKVKELLVELISKKIQELGFISLIKVEEICNMMNQKYKASVSVNEIIQTLIGKGCLIEEGKLKTEPKQKAFKLKINEKEAGKIAYKMKKKKMLGIFGKEEKIKEIKLVYEPVYKVNYNLTTEHGFKPLSCYATPDYELCFYDKNLKKTKSLKELNEKKIKIINLLRKTSDLKEISKQIGLTAKKIKEELNELMSQGFVEKKEEKYKIKHRIPEKIDSEKFLIEKKILLEKPQSREIEEKEVDEKKLMKIPGLFGNCEVKDCEIVLKPVWRIIYESEEGIRIEKIDGV